MIDTWSLITNWLPNSGERGIWEWISDHRWNRETLAVLGCVTLSINSINFTTIVTIISELKETRCFGECIGNKKLAILVGDFSAEHRWQYLPSSWPSWDAVRDSNTPRYALVMNTNGWLFKGEGTRAVGGGRPFFCKLWWLLKCLQWCSSWTQRRAGPRDDPNRQSWDRNQGGALLPGCLHRRKNKRSPEDETQNANFISGINCTGV